MVPRSWACLHIQWFSCPMSTSYAPYHLHAAFHFVHVKSFVHIFHGNLSTSGNIQVMNSVQHWNLYSQSVLTLKIEFLPMFFLMSTTLASIGPAIWIPQLCSWINRWYINVSNWSRFAKFIVFLTLTLPLVDSNVETSLFILSASFWYCW